MRKIHTVYLDEDTLNLAQVLGLENLSDFVRDCLLYFVSGSDRELTKSEIRELSKKFALEKRAAVQQQQKLTGCTEEEQAQIEAARQKRLNSISVAVKFEVDRIGSERFAKYMEDTFGDFSTIQDDIIQVVSKTSGYPVDLADVIAAFQSVKA